MDNLKQLFFNRFKILFLLGLSISFSIVLLMIRIKISLSFFYLFLVWNLFLAVIPFTITTYLVSLSKLNKVMFIFWFSIWLLFLPNAPYIVTDFIHLKLNTNTKLIWLDLMVVTSFAGNGLIFFYLSLVDMKSILKSFIKPKKTNFISIVIIFLSAFGVYLGRFLRYNSWEILSNPKQLLLDIINIFSHPLEFKEAGLFTLIFGVFLTICLYGVNQIIDDKSTFQKT